MRLFSHARTNATAMPAEIQEPVFPTDRAALSNVGGRMAVPAGSVTNNAPFVTRAPRQNITHMYSYGKQSRNWLPMVMTGGVESTRFEPYNGTLTVADFNHGLYEAGFPVMTGISFKVAHVPTDLTSGQAGPHMQPQPQQRNSIFTRRSFHGAPSLPAKPAAS